MPSYQIKAGTYSPNGMVVNLGVTSEREAGYLIVQGANNWKSRLLLKNYTSGPTGAWKNEWLSVYNFLQYAPNSVCYVGGTASVGSYTGYSLANTPLHNKSIVDLDVVFDAGNTLSATAVKSIAQTRQDCVALIGNKSNMSPVSSSYDSENTDFGITSGDSEYICFIAGRRQYDIKGIDSTWKSEYNTTNFSADVAGLIAANTYTYDISYIVAGAGTGKNLLNATLLSEQYSDTDVVNLVDANINPIRQFAGLGTYLMGNKTYKNNSSSPLNNLNLAVSINYIKRETKKIALKYLFKPNNANTRSLIAAEINNLLKGMYLFSPIGGGVATVICDNTNNTSATTLTVTINLTMPSYVGTITLNIVNSTDGTTVTTTTI